MDPRVVEFLQNNSFEDRYNLSLEVINRYPDKIPIIISRGEFINTPRLSQFKVLAPKNITFGNFIKEIRKRLPSIKSTMGLYFFVQDEISINPGILMNDLYQKYKSLDGFLYVKYTAENVFG